MWSPFTLVLLVFLGSRVSALKPIEYCVYGCEGILYQVTFEGSSDECSNRLQIETVFGCAAVYCSTPQIEAGVSALTSYCASQGTPLPSFGSIISSLNLSNINRISSAEIPAAKLTRPVIPDAELFELSYKTIAQYYNNYNLSTDLAWSIPGFWGLVIVIGVIHRAAKFFHRVRTSRAKKVTSSKHRYSRTTTTWTWFRRHLLLPSTVRQRHQEPILGCGTLPPRLQSLLLLLYIMLNIIYCFPGYKTFTGNLYWAENKTQLARYIGDRTGILAMIHVPCLWVFSARNDSFLWLTGWSFATYNSFHRWTARVCTVQAIVHAIAYSVFSVYDSYWVESWTEEYWYTGVIALVVMSFMIGASFYSFRKSHYDLFLVTHIFLSIVFLVGLYYHIRQMGAIYKDYIWMCVAMWSVDRALRIARIVYISVLPRYVRGIQATATYDSSSEMIRVDVSDFIPDQTFNPGIYYYVYMPGELRGYESHPFTLCSWTRDAPLHTRISTTFPVGDNKQIKDSFSTASDESEASEVRKSFLIRPYEGFTQRLRNKILASKEAQTSCQLTLLLEGPYGTRIDLSSFSNVLIVAGGGGITAAISHTHHVLRTGSTNIRIVFAAPQRHLIDDLCSHELAAVIRNDRVHMTVYLTRGAVSEPAPPALQLPYELRHGRPDLIEVMVSARSECAKDLAIVSCGPPKMSDACRQAVVRLLGESGAPVEYFDEAVLW